MITVPPIELVTMRFTHLLCTTSSVCNPGRDKEYRYRFDLTNTIGIKLNSEMRPHGLNANAKTHGRLYYIPARSLT